MVNVTLCLAMLDYIQKPAMDSLIVTSHSGVITSYITVASTLLPQARNKLVEHCYTHNSKFTHILFVDSDMSNYDGGMVKKLLERDVDIISAAVVNRKPPYRIVADFPNNDIEAIRGYFQRGDMIESRHVGMAFTLIKREALDVMREDTTEGPIWFNHDRDPRETFKSEIEDFLVNYKNFSYEEIVKNAIAFGQTSHIGSCFLGEDINFCHRATKLGFKIYVDCGIQVGHLDTNPVIPEILMREREPEKKLKLIGADDE